MVVALRARRRAGTLPSRSDGGVGQRHPIQCPLDMGIPVIPIVDAGVLLIGEGNLQLLEGMAHLLVHPIGEVLGADGHEQFGQLFALREQLF